MAQRFKIHVSILHSVSVVSIRVSYDLSLNNKVFSSC